MTNKLIFVYGTLRTNGMFAFHMPPDSKMILTELHGVQMYDLGTYPGLVRTDNRDDYVVGEIHDCSYLPDHEWNDLIFRLDLVENIKGGLFKRETIDTSYGDAIIYVVNRKEWFDEVHHRSPFTMYHDWAELDPLVAKGVDYAKIRSKEFKIEKKETVAAKG